MKHKTTKISMGVTLLVCAMLSLAGVAFAIAYQGSATTPIDDTSGELVTVGITEKTGIFGVTSSTSVFTVNTSNDGTNVTVDALKKNGTTLPSYEAGHFTYSDAFTWVTGAPVEHGYASAVAGSVSLSATQSADENTTTDYFRMTIVGLNATQTHPYGMSLIYTYKIGTGTETVMDGTTFSLALTPGTPVSVVVTAYVVYNTYVAVGNIGQITPLALADGSTVSFTVEAQDTAF